MDPGTLKRKLFEYLAVMSKTGNGSLSILFEDIEKVSPLTMLLNMVTMAFFSSTFASLIPGDAERVALVSFVVFFMQTKAHRDRVGYLRRSTRFARGYPYLYKVFAYTLVTHWQLFF